MLLRSIRYAFVKKSYIVETEPNIFSNTSKQRNTKRHKKERRNLCLT